MNLKQSLLLSLEEGYQKKTWHGPNLRGSLRGVTAREALWRPAKGRHNIWEIAVHAAYWKYILRRRLLGEKKGSFPFEGSNWFPRESSLSEKDWSRDLALLNEMHNRMRDAIISLDPKRLESKPKGSNVTNHRMIFGIAAHDIYHAGQIQLLKRLMQK